MTGFRGALIGCGFFARNHMHGWAAAQGAEIVAVCDLDRSKAETFAAEFGVQGVYSDAAAMLAEARQDFVDVATTVESHRRLVEMCLGSGALTICQKPFAGTYSDAQAMVAAAERAGRPLIVHENFRWQKPFRVAAEHIAGGAIGRPRFGRFVFRHGYDVYANQPYLAEIEDFALMDVGLHLFDVVRFTIGEVTRVYCRTQRRKADINGEDEFVALLDHEGGAVSSVECCFYSQIAPDPFPQTLVWIEGELGSLEIAADYRVRLHRDGAVEETDCEPPVPGWGARPWHAVQDSVAAFEAHVVDVLAGRADPQPSGAHNLRTLAITLAAYRSADRGEAVELGPFVAAGAVR